ncbi:hypothetical protein N7524_010060 [Penicillium chrysogenum]|jgi:hypothetical protein|nr:hypothetical protein N7524_010060 [Penicillium chrysogenum]
MSDFQDEGIAIVGMGKSFSCVPLLLFPLLFCSSSAPVSLSTAYVQLQLTPFFPPACRLPGDVQDPQSFWDLLISQKLARGPFPGNRFNADAFYNPQKGRPGNMRYTEGYCISNKLEDFDGGFFGMTAPDILCLDPQQRQLLECCFECLESGGITLEDVSSTMTGVYVGNFASDYETLAFKEPERIEGMAVLGMGRTTVSNRVSYMYNLHGPRFDFSCFTLHFRYEEETTIYTKF